MIIYRAIRRYNLLSQGFGKNNTKPEMLEKYQAICSTQNGIKQCLQGHNGWDWPLPHGEQVYWDCSNRGRVWYIDDDDTGGRGVYVISQDTDGKWYMHRFWHFKACAVQPGQILDSGDLLGWGDNTGWSTGDHLHRDLKLCNKNGNTINWDNGYFGCIDIAPFFKNVFVLDEMKFLGETKSILQKMVEILTKVVALYQIKKKL